MKHRIKKIFAILCLVSTILPQMSVSATEEPVREDELAMDRSYCLTVYDRREKLPIKNFNSVVQTSEGRIWVGGYDGLYSYDGLNFEKENLPDGVNCIYSLLVDDDNSIWIGTNDKGLFRYNPLSGEIRSYRDIIECAYIHSLVSGKDGSIFVGAGNEIYCIQDEDTIRRIENAVFDTYPKNMTYDFSNDILYGVTNGGVFFGIGDNEVKFTTNQQEGVKGSTYTAVAAAENGDVVVGTTNGKLFCVEYGNGAGKVRKLASTNLGDINNIFYDASGKAWLLSGEKGFGIVGTDGRFKDFSNTQFCSSIKNSVMDSQGNYWFVSDSQGVCKVSANLFVNVLENAKIEKANVNAITSFMGDIYLATDNGLIVVDEDTNTQKFYDFISQLEGVRVRHLLVDSKNRLWISSYGDLGLICVDSEYHMKNYNATNSGIEGTKLRLTAELPDGTIIVSSTKALSFLKDGVVVKTIDIQDGLKSQILTMYVDEDGTLYAGSDGNGLYVIRNNEIVRVIDEEEGLSSLVIMKIVPYKEGLLFSASNGLYYDDGSHENIVFLSEFPESNNYDIYIKEDGETWVTGGNGIYIANIDDIVSNERNYKSMLLNDYYGLNASLTAISWNYVDDENNIYLCTDDGILKVSLDINELDFFDYEIGISEIVGDDSVVITSETREYIIEKGIGRISIHPAFYNYRLNNPLIHVYLENFDDKGIYSYQTELSEISYTNLTIGSHKLHIQVVDDKTGGVMKEEIFVITKKGYLYQYLWMQVICTLLVFFAIAMIFLFVINHYSKDKLRREREKMLTFFSYNDDLTGAYNRRALEERADKLKPQCTLGIVFGDIMGLKHVNDSQGHDAGDQMILRAYHTIKDVFGEENVYRTGGDEFVVLVENIMGDELRAKVEGLSETLKEHSAEMALGYSWTQTYAGNYSEMHRIADEMMYENKKKRYRETGYKRGHVL